MQGQQTHGQQTIVAHFDSRGEAEKAMSALAEAGLARDAMRLLPEAQSSYQRSGTAYDHSRDEGGFWASLGNVFLPDEDRYAYAEGMSRGGVTLAVTAGGAQAARVAEIVERYGAVDMDEREETWRREGWTGYAAGSATRGTAATASDREAIPIVEEEIRVGKRQVSGGRVRVRSYVVETPVEEQVTLREEHVRVERRPVDRVLTPEEEARLLQDRTIEAEERSEEAVVAKEARVKEELVIDKTAEERTQTVSDTVRRTEVEIEDERTRDERLSGTTGTTNDRTRR